MAARTIAITLTIDNRDAINAAKAQQIAMQTLNEETEKQTQLQEGLTNSFVKGNLAARAISITYLAIRDSLRFAASEAVNFQANMTKIAAITDSGTASLSSLEKTIREVSIATNQNQNELAKTALEMAKIGLTTNQVEEALGSVAKLSRALDEDLVKTGETVVSVLNVYGLRATDAKKITDELAYTVRISALDMQKFGTAFGLVGGTAASAGVKFEELQGAMDVLSNSGLRASTIGTGLRRIIADLSDENSKAGKAAGGTIESYGGLANALEALRMKNIDVAGLTEIFGRTASSAAYIAIKYADSIKLLADQTAAASGVTDKMSAQMNTTLLASLQGIKAAWVDLGIEISKSAGFLKTFADKAKEALDSLSDSMSQTNLLERFKQENPNEFYNALRREGTTLFGNHESKVAESPEFIAWKAKFDQAQLDAKRKEDIVAQLESTFQQNFKLPNDNKDHSADIPVEDTYMYNYLRKLFGTDEAGFEAAVKKAKLDFALKLERVSEDKFDNDSLKKAKKNRTPDFDPMDVFDKLDTMVNAKGDTYQEKFLKDLATKRAKQDKKELSSEIADERAMERYIDQLEAFKKKVAESRVEVQLFKTGVDDLAAGLDNASHVFGEQMVESLVRGKNAFKDFDDLFGNLVKKIIADLVALSIKFLLFQAIVAMMPGAGLGGFAFKSSAISGGESGFLGTLLQSFGGKAFASGTDQVVNKPTLFMAGEAGRERVTVTPRGKSSSSGGNIHVTIQGNVFGGEAFTQAVEMAQAKLRGRNV